MLGRRCIRKKTVYSPVLGRKVRRCAQFSGGSALAGATSLGAFPISLDQLKNIGLTGAVAVGGAVVSQRAVGYIAPLINVDPADPRNMKWIGLLEVGTGVLIGFLVGKYAKKPDIGAAVAVGPIVTNGLKLVSYFIAPSVPAAGYRGYAYAQPQVPALPPAQPPAQPQQELGVPIAAGTFPPGWMYQSPFLSQAQQQIPAWAYAA